ncbi:MAG: hypothetical protein Q9193_000112 [Seirophora villosa]
MEAPTSLSKDWVKSVLDDVAKRDDAFCSAFLSGIIFYGSCVPERNVLDGNVEAFLSSLGNRWTESINSNELDRELLPGAYVLQNGRLWKVARLYDDTAEVFSVGLQTLPDRSFIPLHIQGTGQKAAIAVASRLPNSIKNPLPLAGYRITVKEIFDVQGVKTRLGSRAFAELYPPASKTAPAVQKLIDAGANLLGISKMCSMVLKAPPTQCIDVSAPFNPRGDGYLSPSGGSSGQAAAVAAYEWVDFAIGSDSTFSGRMPAQANGCFAIRPTRIFEAFVEDLGRFLGVSVETISVVDLWERSPPSEADGVPLTEYLNKESFPRDRARTVSPEQHEKALARLSVYKHWLLRTYLQSGRRNAILVLPLEEVIPLHRDEWPG